MTFRMTANANSLQERKPLHDRVAENLRRNVLAGLHPGVKLESEAHLAQQLGVSVHTLRQALSVLAHEGLIERRHGSGTVVADRQPAKAIAVCSALYDGLSSDSFQMLLFIWLNKLFRRRGYRCRSYLAPVEVDTDWQELAEDVAQ